MLRLIPWDVWIAAAASLVCLVAIFDLTPTIFVVIYLGLCAYMAAETFGNDSTDS